MHHPTTNGFNPASGASASPTRESEAPQITETKPTGSQPVGIGQIGRAHV